MTYHRALALWGRAALRLDLTEETLLVFEAFLFGARAGAAVSAAGMSLSSAGSFCLSLSTGAKRSPDFSTRCKTWSDEKTSSSGSPFFRQLSTSCHVTGVETVGWSLRSEEHTSE